jgi:hypothetical protein
MVVVSAARRENRVRSGRDDKFVLGKRQFLQSEQVPMRLTKQVPMRLTNLSSLPKRSAAERSAVVLNRPSKSISVRDVIGVFSRLWRGRSVPVMKRFVSLLTLFPESL